MRAYRDARRLKEFHYGRMVGKQLIAEQLGDVSAHQIEIVSRDSAGRAIRPRIPCGTSVAALTFHCAHRSWSPGGRGPRQTR